jgi:hypothetical protein
VRLKSIESINVSDLTKNLQFIKKDGDNIKMAWWIPTIYWQVVTANSDFFETNDTTEFIDTLDEYILIATVNIEMTYYGDFKTLPKKVQLQDAQGIVYDELKGTEISENYVEVLSNLKPSMTQTLGDLGRQMSFHVFKKTDKDGNLINALATYGKFNILLNTDSKFVFKLPLPSTVEEKVCPKDGELLNGNWKYCPWHGKKLKLQTK